MSGGAFVRRYFFVVPLSLILLVAIGCGGDTGEHAEPLPSPDVISPVPVDTNTPQSLDSPVVNVQFIGAADLSDERKSSLADVIERIQTSVVQIVVSGEADRASLSLMTGWS